MADQYFQLCCLVHREHRVGNRDQFLARSYVIKIDRTGNVQRTHCRKSREVKWRDRTACSSIESEEAARTKALQGLFKGSLAYSVVYDINPLIFRDPHHFFVKLGLCVHDNFI